MKVSKRHYLILLCRLQTSVKDRDTVHVALFGISSQRGKDSLFGNNGSIINDQTFNAMLRDIARDSRDFVHRNSVHIQCTLLASKDLLRDDFGIPVDSNILSGLIKAHAMFQDRSIRAIKDAYDCMKQGKGSFVILDTRQMNTRRVNEFQVLIIY